MRVGSFFSGIGGLDLGLQRAGMKIIYQCEIDPFCRKILKKNFGSKVYGDIRTVPTKLPHVDLLAGGFPCQPVSNSGKRLGTKDERWLWDWFAEIIWEQKPRWVVIENVEGLRTRGFTDILRSLAASGYDAEWDYLPAAAFGAPHIRYRIFIVAYPQGKNRSPRVFTDTTRKRTSQSPVAFEITSVNRNAFDSNFNQNAWLNRESKRVVAAIPPLVAGERWWRFEPKLARMVYGISDRVDRTTGLGNAVIPQIAQWVGEKIMNYERGH